MSSVCYLILCVNLLYYFQQAESFLHYKTWKEKQLEVRALVKSLTTENQDESLAKLISPFWKMRYDEQLDIKQDACSELFGIVMKRCGRLKNLMSYRLLHIVPSPVTVRYRNKDEFHINYGIDGNPKTVGCLIGSSAFRKVFSIRPKKIITIRESHKIVAQVYEDFIRLSPIRACIIPIDGGHWSTLLVRSNEAGDVMVSVSVKPFGYKSEVIMEQQQLLKEYFIKHLPNITLYHQVCPIKRCTHAVAPFTLLYGNPTITDTLNDFKFVISPDSILPNNLLGAGTLYDSIAKVAKLNPKTTVLDLYCNSGTNGIIMSELVKRVVGIEPFPQSVKEAEYLVEFNNIHNVKFLMGNVNENLNSVLETIKVSSDLVVILNHRLRRLEEDIIKTIRLSVKISKVVYVSYQPNSEKAIRNFVDLCSWNNSKIPPFTLKKVIPIDVFPQTEHLELVLLFQRIQESYYK